MNTGTANNNQSAEGTDLQQYKKAAELAYQYARNKSEKQSSPDEDLGQDETDKDEAV